MYVHLRIARPATDLAITQDMYCRGLGLQVLDKFVNHSGFDGVMLGSPDAAYHFEFTRCHNHPVAPSPTVEDLTVFYIPDTVAWQATCAHMREAGFKQVTAFNSYWEINGRTFQDRDGYLIVLQNRSCD